MGKAPKPVALQTANLTKEQIETRQEQEERLKGNDDRVYRPPKELRKEIKAIYKNLVDELRDANILNNLDIEILTTTANAIYMMKEARRCIEKSGSVILDKSGKLVKSPYVQVEESYYKIFHTCSLQLGLSPSSRAKIAMIAAESEEDDDEF